MRLLLTLPRPALLARGGSLLLVLVAGLALSLGAFWFSADHENHEAERAFAAQANDLATTVDATLGRANESVAALQHFLAATEPTFAEFARFASRQLERYPGIQALEWIPRVRRAERGAYERAARAEGFSSFTFREVAADGSLRSAGMRAEYFPVYFVQPVTGNEAAAGFDLASNPARLAALNEARDTGQPVATGPITLVQERERQVGFRIFAPVYNSPTASTIDERRKTLSGFARGVFRVSDLIGGAVSLESSAGIGFHLADTTTREAAALFEHREVPGPDASMVDPAPPPGRFGLSSAIDLGRPDRTWELTVFADRSYNHVARLWIPPGLLAIGLVVTALLTAYLAVLRGHTRKVERLVDARTAELAKAHHQLEALVQTDALTGLLNRRGIERQAEAEVARAQRRSTTFSVVIADLDDFKRINDVYGHETGDRVLEGVASAFAEATRPYDSVGRWGGDEFLILLPAASAANAEQVIDRCRQRIGSIDLCGGVGASFGAATADNAATGFKALVQQADAAMYAMKRRRAAADMQDARQPRAPTAPAPALGMPLGSFES